MIHRGFHIVLEALLILALASSCARWSVSPHRDAALVDRSLSYASERLNTTMKTLGDSLRFPVSTLPDGSWKTQGIYDWRSGFFPGCLWYAYEYTRDASFKNAAVKWTQALEPIKEYTGNHDVGFMMFCSYGNGYRLTGDPAYREILLRAARSLATRYNPTVGQILSWNPQRGWKFPVIVDNMMNLELLFWASKNGGDVELAHIAETHAFTTMKNHVRPDGSTYHVVDYDPSTGAVLARKTSQGYADSSTWSRGEAWGLYGFTMTYRETRNPVFLETARSIADYFITHLPKDFIPYWDFQAPAIPDEPRDTSAAAIAASGLLELSTLVTDTRDACRYRRSALSILSSLSSPPYLTRGMPGSAVLAHGTGSKPHGAEVDVSLIYGDYYFMEALLRLKRGM